jgi:hypothetical protein
MSYHFTAARRSEARPPCVTSESRELYKLLMRFFHSPAGIGGNKFDLYQKTTDTTHFEAKYFTRIQVF